MPFGLVLRTVPALRSTSSFRLFIRPQKKKRHAKSVMTVRAPTTIPAIVPGERLRLADVLAADGAGVLVAFNTSDGVGASAGHGSPGLSINVLFIASSCCVLIVMFLLGLIAPTMPYVKQLPGAEQ